MKLSIVTINFNNSTGLAKTLKSVEDQTCQEFKHFIIDGGSTDDSVRIIREYEVLKTIDVCWISEPDKGIYNAMNKGIRMALDDGAEYIQVLNSGDCLASPDVTERMLDSLKEEGYPPILYGNMLKQKTDGRIIRDLCFAGQDISFLGFYTGTLNHSPAYIKRSLFDKYGMYDESLKIVSDWKWYLQSIILGGEKPAYADIDVTLFDMTGISETCKDLDKAERKKVLDELINPRILADYGRWAREIDMMKRIERHPVANKMVWFIERCLFKMEKWNNKRKAESRYL